MTRLNFKILLFLYACIIQLMIYKIFYFLSESALKYLLIPTITLLIPIKIKQTAHNFLTLTL